MPEPYSQVIIEAANSAKQVGSTSDTLINFSFAYRDQEPISADVSESSSSTASAAAASSSSVRSKRKIFEELTDEQLMNMSLMRQDLESAVTGTACHDQAVQLMKSLRSTPQPGFIKNRPPRSADSADSASQDATFLGEIQQKVIENGNCCVSVRTAYHSFVLIVHNNKVDSIEAWGGVNAENALSLDDCLGSHFTTGTREEFLSAIPNLLHNTSRIRNAAFKKLSRAGTGTQRYFTKEAIREMTIEVAPLKGLAAFTKDVTAVIQAGASWEKLIAANKEKIDVYVAKYSHAFDCTTPLAKKAKKAGVG